MADEVELKNGDRITGRVVEQTSDKIVLETDFGALAIPRSQIARLEITSDLRDKDLEKTRELLERYRELTDWCEKNGFHKYAAENRAVAERLEKFLSGKLPDADRVETNAEVFKAVWQTVRNEFYDKETYNGCDWESMYDKYLGRAKRAPTPQALYDTCNLMLRELNASHNYLMSPYIWKTHMGNEFKAKDTLQAGIEIQKRGKKYFVRTVYQGGPSDEAGVKVGDEVVTINGKPVSGNQKMVVKDGISGEERVLYTLDTQDEADVTLGLRRKKNGPLIEIVVTPGLTSMVRAAGNSVGVIERRGKRLGYIRLYHYMTGRMAHILMNALDDDLADCDGLVLDIRGRGGSGHVISRIIRVFTRKRWTRPTVLVVDEETSSAKEIFAYLWKRENLGPVVGLTTAGHVLACGFVEMPDGSALLVARHNVSRMTDGVVLEGKGVDPDVEVKKSFEYCAGSHPMVEKALEVLNEKLGEKPGPPPEKRWHFQTSRASTLRAAGF